MIRSFISLAALSLLAAPSVVAQAFTPDDVDQFAATIQDLRASSAASEVTAEMPSMPNPSAMMMGGAVELPELPLDDEGRLATLREMMADAPAGSPEMSEAEAIVSAHGYSSLMEYATEGDYIMAAYMALNMGDQDLSGMDASQLDMLPPAMKARLQPSINWMNTMAAVIEAVPASEVEIVKAKRSVLESAMGD